VQLNVHDRNGQVVRQIAVQDAVFAVPFAQGAVHQAYVRQLANRRQGTHSTKTRGEVAGSTRKLYRQKGTGRARQGSIRAPHRRGGGIAHGPQPRDYRQDIPKKMASCSCWTRSTSRPRGPRTCCGCSMVWG
jgi:large subunit ribosomal protein L4